MRKHITTNSNAVWQAHRQNCASCQKYDKGQPASLGYVCISGARLVKDVLELKARHAGENAP